eukprot:gene12752-17097_t
MIVVEIEECEGIRFAIVNLDNGTEIIQVQRNLIGRIPTSVAFPQHLIKIDLKNNQLSGPIPDVIMHLFNLKILNLSSNRLSGSIPDTIGKLIKLEQLHLHNNQLSGSIPASIGKSTKLEQLFLNNNQLSGSIPDTIGKLIKLETLFLSNNQLSGSIPTDIGKLIELKILYLHNNQLSGSIPGIIRVLAKLEKLWLNNNQLSGSIPIDIGELIELETLYLHNNQLSGTIPITIGKLIKLETLFLCNNQLSGSIPDTIGELTKLELLYLHSNHLSGSIPSTIGDLIKLEQLRLHDNQLSGFIPANIGKLIELEQLWLNSNELSDPIPTDIGKLIKLEQLYLHNNQLSGSIPDEIGDLKNNLEQLNLSNNQLTGPIPDGIGNLIMLEGLDLYNNQLSGHIPDRIGYLIKLERLYLNNNQLSGPIPILTCRNINISDNPDLVLIPIRVKSLNAWWEYCSVINHVAIGYADLVSDCFAINFLHSQGKFYLMALNIIILIINWLVDVIYADKTLFAKLLAITQLSMLFHAIETIKSEIVVRVIGLTTLFSSLLAYGFIVGVAEFIVRWFFMNLNHYFDEINIGVDNFIKSCIWFGSDGVEDINFDFIYASQKVKYGRTYLSIITKNIFTILSLTKTNKNIGTILSTITLIIGSISINSYHRSSLSHVQHNISPGISLTHANVVTLIGWVMWIIKVIMIQIVNKLKSPAESSPFEPDQAKPRPLETQLSSQTRKYRDSLSDNQRAEFDALWGLDNDGSFIANVNELDYSFGWNKMLGLSSSSMISSVNSELESVQASALRNRAIRQANFETNQTKKDNTEESTIEDTANQSVFVIIYDEEQTNEEPNERVSSQGYELYEVGRAFV